MRRRFRREPPRDTGPRRNEQIRIRNILLIDHDGRKLGVVTSDDGRERARDLGLDLVEVAPEARPPVCRIMDYGRYRYELAKKNGKQSKQQVETKTIRLRPNTDDHDLSTKLRKASKFLDRGDKVRLVMRMRGRERAYPGRWVAKLREVIDEVEVPAKITASPQVEGRVITTVLEPA